MRSGRHRRRFDGYPDRPRMVVIGAAYGVFFAALLAGFELLWPSVEPEPNFAVAIASPAMGCIFQSGMQKDLRGRDMLAIAAVAVSMAYGVALAVSDACARAGFDRWSDAASALVALPVTIPVALGLVALAERRSLPR